MLEGRKAQGGGGQWPFGLGVGGYGWGLGLRVRVSDVCAGGAGAAAHNPRHKTPGLQAARGRRRATKTSESAASASRSQHLTSVDSSTSRRTALSEPAVWRAMAMAGDGGRWRGVRGVVY